MLESIYNDLKDDKYPSYIKINADYLRAYARLSDKQLDLLDAMISMLDLDDTAKSYIGRATYVDFGYDNKSVYHRDKKALVEAGFLLAKGSLYFVRLSTIMYTSDAAYGRLLEAIGLKTTLVFGKKQLEYNHIPQPPKK